MSMPHVCRCAVCNRTMDGFGWRGGPVLFGIDLAAGPDKSGFMCTKHGFIDGPTCTVCAVERASPSEGAGNE